mmetsp:Transcript_7763/g.16789  ORF Transcript_7763/g.16789 Transcript_7763/m.16789 type:complete len:190 (+) Transcript_7763:371-940(+)
MIYASWFNCITLLAGCDVDDSGVPDSACHRLVLSMTFQHNRTLPEGAVKGWLLEVSDTLTAKFKDFLELSYTGDESVRTFQSIVITGVKEKPEDTEAVCDIIEEEIGGSSSLLDNYTILAVECNRTQFFPAKQARGLPFKTRVRRLAEGILEVDFTVTGQYRTAARIGEKEEDVDKDFSERVEVGAQLF